MVQVFLCLQGSVGGFTDVSITTNSVSQGGAESEDNESVKFNAFKFCTKTER